MKRDALLGSSAVAVLADGVLNSFDLILGSVDVLLGSVDLLYPIVLVLNRLADGIAWLDQDVVANLMLVIGVLYLVHLLFKLKQRVQNEP